jgi:hypothetical protein
MTSTFGSDSGFSSIANRHLYLYLQNDKVTDDLSYCNLFNHNIRDDKMILGKEYQSDLLNNTYLNSVQQYTDRCRQNMALNKPVVNTSSKKVTVYSLLSEMPFLSETKKIVDAAMYQDVLTNDTTPITFFAFENESAEFAYNWLAYFDDLYYTRQFLKANTLPFSLNPHSLVKRKVKLTTMLDSNWVYADGFGKDLVFYIQSNELNNFTYSEKQIVIKVKSWIETQNGFLYILEKPILPSILI